MALHTLSDLGVQRVMSFIDTVDKESKSVTTRTGGKPSRVELLQGPLNLLILRTLLFGPTHGHSIAKHIQRTSEELLQVETGSLYPALHRLEARGWLEASWERSDRGKRARYYRL